MRENHLKISQNYKPDLKYIILLRKYEITSMEVI